MSENPEYANKIEFDRVYSFRVGSIPVMFGRIATDETSAPVIFAAALSEKDLRNESCGYGTSEADAAADLFRLMRL
jgi:hypothetical protein